MIIREIRRGDPDLQAFAVKHELYFHRSSWISCFDDRLKQCVILNRNEELIGCFLYFDFRKAGFRFIITPPWTWHDHGNPGTEPVVWMDGLDINILAFFDAQFAENYPEEVQPVTRAEGDSQARYGQNLLPLGLLPETRTSPIFSYPYARSRDALAALAKNGDPDPCHGWKMRYANPLTGGFAMATVGAGYERSYAPSFGFGGSSSSQELRGYVFMPFTRSRIYVNASGMWRRTNPLLLEELALDSFIVDTTAGYGLSRWLRFEVFHHFSRQDSRITGGEINRHRLGAQVVISQPMRIQ